MLMTLPGKRTKTNRKVTTDHNTTRPSGYRDRQSGKLQAYGWEFITEAQYHAYLDLFRRGREAIENHPPTISEMALAIMRKVIRDLESDKREYEFSALTPEQQVVELQRAEQARKEWKAHIAQLREKQGRVLKSEDLEASHP